MLFRDVFIRWLIALEQMYLKPHDNSPFLKNWNECQEFQNIDLFSFILS